MTWFKVDDTLAFHRKVVQAGNPAMGLWVRAGAWCAQQLTDGFIPSHMVSTIGTASQAKRLVAAGLWIETDGGFAFHQWSEDNRQPTKESVLADRQSNARRTALHRDRDLTTAVRKRDADRCRYCGVLVAWTDRRSGIGGTYDHVDPLGPNTLENVVVACRACNSAKGNRPLSPSGMQLLPPKSFGKAAGHGVEYSEQNQNASGSDLDQYKTPSRPGPTRSSTSGRPDQSSPVDIRADAPARDQSDRLREINGTAQSARAYRLVKTYRDACSTRPPTKVLNDLGRQIDALIADGIAEHVIEAGLSTWAEKNLGPGALPSVVNQVLNDPDGPPEPPIPTDPDAPLTDGQARVIIGNNWHPPVPPDDVQVRGVEAVRAWSAAQQDTWRQDREDLARAELRRRRDSRAAFLRSQEAATGR